MAGRQPRPPADWEDPGTHTVAPGDRKPEPVIGPPASQT
jgi:hypothetical protein